MEHRVIIRAMIKQYDVIRYSAGWVVGLLFSLLSTLLGPALCFYKMRHLDCSVANFLVNHGQSPATDWLVGERREIRALFALSLIRDVFCDRGPSSSL